MSATRGIGFIAMVAIAITRPTLADAVGSRCAAKKFVAVGQYVAHRSKCAAKAARLGGAIDRTCEGHATLKFTVAMASADREGDCVTSDDRLQLEGDVDAFLAVLIDRLSPTGSTTTISTTSTTSTTEPPGNIARYTYTGTLQTFQVPSGVTDIVVKAWGAGGGGRCGWGGGEGSHGGGGGGFAEGTISVVPGETLAVLVGGGGGGFSWYTGSAGGFGGGGDGGNSTWAGFGGGGRSEVSRGTSALVVAGGGGGAGDRCSGAGYGGAGGGGDGGAAEGGTPTGGAGGSVGAGGLPGSGGSGGTAGTRSQGGDGNGGGEGGGGGGGGGYFGGGGGGAGDWVGAGGGGGSNFVAGADTVLAAADRWLPGNAADADYAAPFGEGGQYDGPQTGEPGLIVIRY